MCRCCRGGAVAVGGGEGAFEPLVLSLEVGDFVS
jgi:hypothetical protein